MRALHILTNCENDQAGNYAVDLILNLHASNIDQCVVISQHAPRAVQLKNAGVRLAPFAMRLPGMALQRLWLRHVIAREKPDVIHCWMREAVRLVPPGKIPVVAWLAGYDDRRHYNRCTYFVSASRDDAARMTKEGNIQTRFIPAFSEVSKTSPLDRNQLATPRDAKVLVSFSHLHPSSQPELLLKALKNLTDCYLWLAGDGPLKPELEKQVEKMGIGDRVRFVRPNINPGALLQAADICVQTGQDKSLGAVIPKAWAAGTPLVASHAGGILQDNIDGLPVPPGDVPALTGAVNRLLEEDELRRRLVARGYATYVKNHSREAIVRQWIDLYRQAAGG